MKVEIGGQLYAVSWRHGESWWAINPRRAGLRNRTQCVIEKVWPGAVVYADGTEQVAPRAKTEVVAVGNTIRNPGDPSNRDIGRKRSLKDALERWLTLDGKTRNGCGMLRYEFWVAFFRRDGRVAVELGEKPLPKLPKPDDPAALPAP